MCEALDDVEWSIPLVPVLANVTVQPTIDIVQIKDNLVRQISGRVRWREAMEFLVTNGVRELVEIGSGKVLTGMLRKVEHPFALTNVGNLVEVEEWLK